MHHGNCIISMKYFKFYRAKLEEAKLAQKLRIKPNGVNAVELAIGQKVTTEELVLKVKHNNQCHYVKLEFCEFNFLLLTLIRFLLALE